MKAFTIPGRPPQVTNGGKWQADQIIVANVDGGYTSTFDVKQFFDDTQAQGTFYRWTDTIPYSVAVFTSKDGQDAAG